MEGTTGLPRLPWVDMEEGVLGHLENEPQVMSGVQCEPTAQCECGLPATVQWNTHTTDGSFAQEACAHCVPAVLLSSCASCRQDLASMAPPLHMCGECNDALCAPCMAYHLARSCRIGAPPKFCFRFFRRGSRRQCPDGEGCTYSHDIAAYAQHNELNVCQRCGWLARAEVCARCSRDMREFREEHERERGGRVTRAARSVKK